MSAATFPPSGNSSSGIRSSNNCLPSSDSGLNAVQVQSGIALRTVMILASDIVGYTCLIIACISSMSCFITSFILPPWICLLKSCKVSDINHWWCAASLLFITLTGSRSWSSSSTRISSSAVVIVESVPPSAIVVVVLDSLPEGEPGIHFSKTKLRMAFLVPNLALYSYNSLVSIPLIGTTFQSVANQNAGFISYCSHCVLKGQSLHEDQSICTNCCTAQLSIFNLGGLQHVQTPKLSTSISKNRYKPV